MKKRTISKLKSIFGSKSKAKRQAQVSTKYSRTPSPEPHSHNGDVFRPVRSPAPHTPPARVGPPPSPPVPTSPVAPVAPDPAGPLPLLPCAVCGRTFVPESLAKHVKICEKTTTKRRKTFDSSRQRREGTDLEQYLPKNFGLPENSPFLEKSPPQTAKTLPRQKSQSVRSAVMKPTADLQKCPHCNRAFGLRAFERHVEWCADKARLLPSAPAQPPAHIADAKQRLNARTQYKAPPVRGRRSSQTRDKCSSRSASVESARGRSPSPPVVPNRISGPHASAPRDCGDCHAHIQARTRTRAHASESISSNEYHEDTTPHIPVIRNTRTSQNSSGDAVKARQARLARDLSNSRSHQQSKSSPIQESNTDPNITKPLHNQNRKCAIKKQQQLKKLEVMSEKYNGIIQKQAEKISGNTESKVNNLKRPGLKQNTERCVKSVPKVAMNKIVERRIDNSQHQTSVITDTKNNNEIKVKKTIKKPVIKNLKANSFSSDSLEEMSKAKSKNENTQSVGTNTELLCPCVPCIIHDDTESRKPNNRNKKNINIKIPVTYINNDYSDDKIELIYKNPTMVSSCDIQAIDKMENYENVLNINTDLLTDSTTHLSENSTFPNNFHRSISNECLSNNKCCVIKNTSQTKLNEIADCLSTENFVENYDTGVNLDRFDDSLQDYDENNEQLDDIDYDAANDHDSGNTYTKFTEDPNNFEEFINITDKLIDTRNFNNEVDIGNDRERDDSFNLHTPNTNSLEELKKVDNETNKKNEALAKHTFSDALSGVKEKLQELMSEVVTPSATHNSKITCDISDVARQVSDMEHITVYKLNDDDEEKHKADIFEFTLPPITETNRPGSNVPYAKKKIHQLYKGNKRYKMFRDLKKDDKNFKTFIVNENFNDSTSEEQSVCSEAPPLKLPRIEKKRLDDGYDPFLSAARQMKELMTSDTNINKKMQNANKDPNRTLPILRPTKQKSPPMNSRSDNTKMLKDTLNKSYQKTPILQRMKSFGGTHNDNNNTFGGRCSSFRLNRNEKKNNSNLNSTFTKSSKENINSVDKSPFIRNSNLNRSFSSYTASSYSTPKPRDKIPKISTSMYHSFQRTTIKQPVKLDKIQKDEHKKEFVNLDSILTDDNSSLTDSNYIDPRLINENDNLPINVNTILNNPDMISSMDSLITLENLPAKFDSFNSNSHNNNYDYNDTDKSQIIIEKGTNVLIAPTSDDLSAQYDKIMYSLEQSIASKASVRDDDSLCEDFDLEEFMTSFDEELHKQKSSENKRTCSSTTRIVKHAVVDDVDSNKTSDPTRNICSPKVVNDNGMIPINKSQSLNFSSNNIVNETLFHSSMKRSTSNHLDSLQKKSYVQKNDNSENRQRNHKADQLEQDIMQSLKDFDKLCEIEKVDNSSKKTIVPNNHSQNENNITKRETRMKCDKKTKKQQDDTVNGNFTPNGKQSNDSAYSSLNRISPSKLSLCTSNPSNGLASLEQIPAGSDSGGSHRENELRSVSSEEFLAMERSTESEVPLRRSTQEPQMNFTKEVGAYKVEERRTSSRASSRPPSRRSPPRRSRPSLSSSGSETSLHHEHPRRLSRFCHECGGRFPVDSAKFCIQCGVRRLLV